jgi:hypothetical protein
MVQVIGTSDPRGKLTDMLGMNLGKGLSEGLNTYFANRSLESVLKDKSLENAPLSKKLEAMRSALSPYGEKGQEVFQNHLQIAQQEAQEEQQRQMMQQQEALEKRERLKGRAVGKFLKGQELTEEEEGLFTPREMTDLYKAKNPNAVGGLSGQPVPPQIGQAIQQVVDANPNANADQLALSLDKQGIPRAYSNSYIENRRRQDETGAKNALDEKKISRKEELEFHKEGSKYDEELLHQTKTAKNNLETLKDIDQAIKSGNVKPSSLANIFKGLGKIGDKISTALLNKDESTLLSSIPQLLEGWKDVFGIRLSDADLRILEDKLPSIGKNAEANNAVVKILKKYADMTLLRGKIGSEIKEKNNGLRPLGYADKIEKRFDEMVKPVKIIRPSTGNTPEKQIEIPAYKLAEALQAGARLSND